MAGCGGGWEWLRSGVRLTAWLRVSTSQGEGSGHQRPLQAAGGSGGSTLPRPSSPPPLQDNIQGEELLQYVDEALRLPLYDEETGREAQQQAGQQQQQAGQPQQQAGAG